MLNNNTINVPIGFNQTLEFVRMFVPAYGTVDLNRSASADSVL